MKTAKRQVKKDYDQLSLDYSADKGKRLYQKGKTITGNTNANYLTQIGVVAGATVAQRMLSTYGNTKMANISAAVIGVGGTFVNATLAIKTHNDNKNLRAYYSHSRNRR